MEISRRLKPLRKHIVYMDLDLVPSAIAVVPDRDVASHGVSLGMQSFTGYFNKMASIHFVVKMYHPFKIVCPKLYSCLLICLRNYQI